jgi:hypothetical protein
MFSNAGRARELPKNGLPAFAAREVSHTRRASVRPLFIRALERSPAGGFHCGLGRFEVVRFFGVDVIGTLIAMKDA